MNGLNSHLDCRDSNHLVQDWHAYHSIWSTVITGSGGPVIKIRSRIIGWFIRNSNEIIDEKTLYFQA